MPWKPGESGNPSGRPKGQNDLMELLRQKIPFERLVGALDKLVEAGDPKTTQYVMDRHLGRPAQAIQISGDAERPLHGLIGVVGREMATLDAPAPAATELARRVKLSSSPAPIEGELVEEEEPDDTGGP